MGFSKSVWNSLLTLPRICAARSVSYLRTDELMTFTPTKLPSESMEINGVSMFSVMT